MRGLTMKVGMKILSILHEIFKAFETKGTTNLKGHLADQSPNLGNGLIASAVQR